MKRRGFCRALGALACAGVGGCKIEPSFKAGREDLPQRPRYAERPPQIPDQLEDADTALWTLTAELLARELPIMTSGRLAERPSESRATPNHVVELMRSFGLAPAGNRGGWLQPVMLDIVEPSGDAPRVVLRPESEPMFGERVAPTPGSTPDGAPDQAPPEGGAPPDAGTSPEGTPPEQVSPEGAPPEGAPPEEGARPDADSPPDAGTPESPGEPVLQRAIALAEFGAFRQRGPALAADSLLLSEVLDYRTPLPSEAIVGRVAVFRAPKELDLDAAGAPAHVDHLMASVRDAGAIGCLLLTKDEGPAIERFGAQWTKRQVRRAGAADQAMLLEGLLTKDAHELLSDALDGEDTWVLDVDLATRGYEAEASNVLGRITGRDRPDEAVVLTASWDTPNPATAEFDSMRLLATIAAFSELAEWSRRSTPPRYSLVLLLTADAGLAAGQSVHAAWAASFGADTKALVALDRPTRTDASQIVLSGHYDPPTAALVRRVVAADGRELVEVEQLALASLSPYLRYPAPVMTVGGVAGDEGEGEDESEGETGDETGGEEERPDVIAALHGDVRMLRNLVLALAARR